MIEQIIAVILGGVCGGLILSLYITKTFPFEDIRPYGCLDCYKMFSSKRKRAKHICIPMFSNNSNVGVNQ